MISRVAISISEEFQERICRQLERCNNITICGVLDWREKPNASNFCDKGFFWTHDEIVNLHRLDYDPSFSFAHIPPRLLLDLKKYESNFLYMTDRLAFYPRSTSDLSRLYFKFCRVWLRAFLDNNVNALIFFSSPHMGFDFVGYAVAKVLDIDVRIVNRTGLGVSSRITTGIDLWNNDRLDEIKLEKDPVLFDLDGGGDLDLSLSNSIAVNDKVFSQHKSRYAFLRVFFKIILKSLLTDLLRFMQLISSSKKSRKESFRWISGPAMIFTAPAKWFFSIETRSLLNFYKKKCITQIPAKNFVLFAAHFQPERSTNPEGGCYGDHLTAINALLACMPEGMPILYKEHPRSFDVLDMRRRFARNRAYFNTINSCENVYLVDPFFDNAYLIREAAAVATITGSSGWQALQIGKPCLVFGDAWYRRCGACLHVSMMDQVSVSQLLNLCEDQVKQKVEKFIQESSRVFVRAPNSLNLVESSLSNLEYDNLVNNMAFALSKSLSN